MRRCTGVLVVAWVIGGCKDEPRRPPPAAADPVAAARASAGAFKAALKRALVAAIGERGPAGAIDVCAREAPRLAGELSTGGVRLGRATRRPRNPVNTASGWQLDAIAHFEAMAPADRADAVFTRTLPGGATAYAEPLIVGDLCLTCHGQAVAPDVTAALAARYPGDQATGYARDDLRGVLWAEVATR